MPNRVLKDQNYRFGFNGKEADREGQWGSTEHYDYGFRIYDPKLGRFLSVDPLTSSYPWYTPYQFAGNTPIQAVDLDGREPLWYLKAKYGLYGENVQLAVGYTEDLVIGLGTSAIHTIGFVTQAGDIANHGNKLSEEQKAQAFPMFAGKTAKQLAGEVIAGPIMAIGNAMEDPSDGKKVGEALALFAPFIAFRKGKSSKPSTLERGSYAEDSFFDVGGYKLTQESPRGALFGQETGYSCTACGLRMALDDLGYTFTESEIAAALNTTGGGASVGRVGSALEKLGVPLKGIPSIRTLDAISDALSNGNTVLIGANVPGKGSHTLLVDGISDGKIFLRDPLPVNAGSSYSIKISDFINHFEGRSSVIER